MPVPQLKLGPDGEMVLDEKSLVIETSERKRARKTLARAEVVFHDEHSANNGFYNRHKRTKNWPADETIKFYRCLQAIGTDFSLMLDLFPNRSRRDLKLKFKKEEKLNGALINKALIYHSTFDVDSLKQMLQEEEDKKLEEKNAVKSYIVDRR